MKKIRKSPDNLTKRVFSFGIFVADMIYRQKQGETLPDEFLGIQRACGDNAMISVPAEWIWQAKAALEGRGISIETNFGGLANAMASVLAALTTEGKITLIAPCGNDPAGQANVTYLERLGVNTSILRKLMQEAEVSASNLIRNFETTEDTKNKTTTYCKDFAFYLTPLEGFSYSRWMPEDLKQGDIVHLGGIDLILCPEDFSKEQKQAKYKKNIEEMVAVARLARQKGAMVVADFCMGDPDFWEIVPDSFFQDVHVAKPGIAQGLAIYNSRHKNHPLKLDVSNPHQLPEKHVAELLEIQDFLLKLGFRAVFMTLDTGGTIISAQDNSVFGKVQPRHVPIIPARKFVDGTGCGDAFVAGIIYGIDTGQDMFTTACFSSAIGSLIAERVGVILEEQYLGRGKWLSVVQARLKENSNFLSD